MAKPVTNLIPREITEPDTKSALAELAEEAEELKRVLEDLKFDRRVVVCDKLQRIVAKLAKVKLNRVGWPIRIELADIYEECRAIAEEGEENEKRN